MTPGPTPTFQRLLLSRLEPGQGVHNVPNPVLIYGANFQPGLDVTIAGVPLLDVTVDGADATRLQAVVPAGLTPGLHDVVAQNPGEDPARLANGYLVIDPDLDDLAVTDGDLWFDPAPARQGQATALGVNVHYAGARALVDGVAVEFRLDAVDGDLLGRTTTPPLTPATDTLEPVFVLWTPSAAGTHTIYAIVDPADAIVEGANANNVARWDLTVLPAATVDDDLTPPVVDAFVVDGGAQATASSIVTITLNATDDRGVTSMYLVERIYNNAATLWTARQTTGWIGFSGAYTMTLSPVGGARYLQVWVADKARNVSTRASLALINYLHPDSTLLQGQVHTYRFRLEAGQTLQAELTTSRGDADLYVWDGAGNLLASNNFDLAPESVQASSAAGGEYQIEVHGYRDSTYTISLGLAAPAVAAQRTATAKTVPLAPVVDLSSAPSGQQALPAAPPAWNLFLPITVR